MRLIRTIKEFQQYIENVKSEKKSVGFIPTMGALHEGHLTLVKQSVTENDITVVSVFVNPTQFNNKTDLEKYPRNVEKDAAMLEEVGCDCVLAPSPEEMYCKDEIEKTFEFDFGGMDAVMEGKFRPGHFNGVVQVVSKLFKLVQPDKSYFGLKDFQQLAIIHRMVETMKFPVEIIDCPIIREPSGLAMSSRNERLTPEQRKNAAKISEVLFESRTFVPSKSPQELINWVVAQINNSPDLDVEYFDIVDRKTLQSIEKWGRDVVGCIAVFCGGVRLIDNIEFTSNP